MTSPETSSGPAPPTEGIRWGAVIACGLAVFITAVDLNVVGVALPALGARFDAAPAAMQWVILAYALPMVALILPAGRWGDTVDKREAFVFAVVGFGLASVFVAVSQSLEMMIVARVVQALFGALISSLVLATIAQSVRPQLMGRAMGLVASLGPLGGAVGPAGGGLLIDALGWQAAFLINVPVCLVAAWLAWVSVPRGTLGLHPPRPRWLIDVLMLGVAGTALLLGLQEFGRPGAGAAIGGVLLVAGIVTLVFWLRRKDAKPVMALFADPFVNRWLIALLFGAVLSGVLNFITPFLLVDGIGVSNGVTGFTMLALSAGMVVFAPLGGALTDRSGPRPVSIVGGILLLAGATLLVSGSTEWGAVDIAWRLALVGAGTGLLAGPTQAAVMMSAPPHLGATAGALSALLLNLGFAVGPAAGSLAWQLTGGEITRTGPAYLVGAAAATIALALLVATRRPRPPATPEAPVAKEQPAG
ncbi:MFS transporter [Nonomuraea jiangxiensis]|uniref:Predicted arabinose efflux permease, MFS family n=1 Tax=Nonomuraea jiangxiensis TaxID=633440 RepID=A0A1G8XZ38_9ACTN|nr:MFS transporter [Nonomuraea jiangxiensis]SDJ95767.1 Predicted arabinose efflux permease, MFS family [Nonomuraea jiangxiensis]